MLIYGKLKEQSSRLTKIEENKYLLYIYVGQEKKAHEITFLNNDNYLRQSTRVLNIQASLNHSPGWNMATFVLL